MTFRVQAGKLALIMAVGGCGGGALAWLHGPAPWLLGSMLAVAAVAFAGVPVALPPQARNIIMPIVGVSLGSGVTPESVAGMMKWPVSLGSLLVAVVLSIAASTAFLVRVAKWDRATAFFASVPGGLSQLLLHATHTRANMGLVVMTHLFRLLVLMAILPLLVTFVPHAPANGAAAGAHAPTSYMAGAAEIVAAIVLGYALALARLPAGMLIGGMIAAAAMHLGGFAEGQLPLYMLAPCHVALGAFVGQRFRIADVKLLRRTVVPFAGSFVISLAVMWFVASNVAFWTQLSFTLVFTAFAPGALEVMTVLALALGVDPAFVAVHHLVRFLGVTLILSFADRLYAGGARPKS